MQRLRDLYAGHDPIHNWHTDHRADLLVEQAHSSAAQADYFGAVLSDRLLCGFREVPPCAPRVGIEIKHTQIRVADRRTFRLESILAYQVFHKRLGPPHYCNDRE